MKKKGLAIVYDPHNLYQFVWYYCNKGKNKKWDALCLPNGYKGEYMHTFCETADIFSDIYRDDTDFSIMSLGKKMKMVISMFSYFLVGRRKNYCRKLINQYVKLDEYDEIVVIADVGVVSGACVALGEEKEVIILEDGINDYGERPRFIPKKKLASLYSWQGFFLALMGYCSPGWFKLSSNKYCVKYASQPEKMIYREYKEIRQLYEREGTDEVLFNQIIRKIYPAVCNIDFEDAQVVLLTRPLEDFVNDYEKYKKRLEEHIRHNYTSVLIKKHPRETGDYYFDSHMKVVEIDNSIPAEVLLPYLQGKDVIVITTSAIMLYMKAHHLFCTNVLFEGMYEESIGENSKYRPLSEIEAREYCENFAEGCYELIII